MKTEQWDDVTMAAKIEDLGGYSGDIEMLHIEYDRIVWSIARLARPDLMAKVDEIMRTYTGDSEPNFWYA